MPTALVIWFLRHRPASQWHRRLVLSHLAACEAWVEVVGIACEEVGEMLDRLEVFGEELTAGEVRAAVRALAARKIGRRGVRVGGHMVGRG